MLAEDNRCRRKQRNRRIFSLAGLSEGCSNFILLGFDSSAAPYHGYFKYRLIREINYVEVLLLEPDYNDSLGIKNT
jgi:hypothetical protein